LIAYVPTNHIDGAVNGYESLGEACILGRMEVGHGIIGKGVGKELSKHILTMPFQCPGNLVTALFRLSSSPVTLIAEPLSLFPS